MKKSIRIIKKNIKNTRYTDIIIIKDAYGQEHMIYPNQEKLVEMANKDIEDDGR